MSSTEDFLPYSDNDYGELSQSRPADFLNKDIEESSRYDTLTNQKIQTKNSEFEEIVDLNDLHRKLANLKQHANVKIRDLTGTLKEDFESLAQYVSLIYNTQSYPCLYNEIQKYFSGDQYYQPGTVGAYCGGCLVKTKDSLPSRGCSVICAGSIPPPYNDSEWDFCDELVIWAVYNGQYFDFTTLNEVEDNSQAIIFIGYDSMDKFPGFSESEKQTLRQHGIKEVRFVYYNPNCQPVYTEVSGGFINLDQVPTRPDNPPTPPPTPSPPDDNSSHGLGGFWIIVIIIVIILLLFFLFGWGCYY